LQGGSCAVVYIVADVTAGNGLQLNPSESVDEGITDPVNIRVVSELVKPRFLKNV